MDGPNPLPEAPFPPPPFEAPATRPTSPPATPGAPSPPFTFYKRMSTPQLAESPPLEFGEPPTGRDHTISFIRPLSHVSSAESLNPGHHARDDVLSVASAGDDAGSVSEALSPTEFVTTSPLAGADIDVEEVPEGDDAENQMGIEIVQPDGFEEPPPARDRQCNGDDCGIAKRFQDLNCDGDDSAKSDVGEERQRRFLRRKRWRMDQRFKRRFSEIEGSDADVTDVERLAVDTDDSRSPARRLRRKVDSPAQNDFPLFQFELQDVDAMAPLSASGSISRPPSIVSDSEGWTALPFNAPSADIMDVDSQAGVQLAPPPRAPP